MLLYQHFIVLFSVACHLCQLLVEICKALCIALDLFERCYRNKVLMN